ncbi:4F2 cell-surface antigen heavy chain [Etheostoma spectabile]|uniref:4F2 cell-surface antigen heavy chain n=1 Tax=Etheostoma spectabile TaxID=54343 RepID=UPI0013AF2480|nr:4F2 cell-surface antigen heavy chain-like [Etheostoma spectabile]
MTTEETNVDLQEAPDQTKDPDPKEAAEDPAPVSADADATEADVSEADLDQEEQEKLPMTGGGDRAEAVGAENGSVKLKMPEEEQEEQGEKEEKEEEQVKFTGLNKEELLRVAGTPGWVRTRWALLVVFWLGWLGMFGGAVLIILQAPRCRDLPPTEWWSGGPLYRIGDIRVFSPTGDLKGVEQKLGSLSQLKVRGLLLGPVHVAPPDEAVSLRFEEISPELGTLEQFRSLVQAAHRKGISVVLDLTPNYRGPSGPWFSNVSVTNVAERLKSALVFWMNEGVDGVQLAGVERVAGVVPSLWSDIRAIVQNGTEERPGRRVLIGVTERSAAEDVSALLSSSGVDLLVSRVLRHSNTDGAELAQSVQLLYSSHSQTRLAWSLGGGGEGHLASLVGPALVRLQMLLLLTLPGTPVFNYGDEIGLMDQETKFPRMLWDSDEELNGTLQVNRTNTLPCRASVPRGFFCSLAALRGTERSLLFGDFVPLSNSSSSLVFLRVWDQSDRYVAAFNWGGAPAGVGGVLAPAGVPLPPRATVVLSTDGGALPADSSVSLEELQLGPGQAALLRFPYAG